MKVVLIDNFDSFVYNLARYVVELGHEAVVLRSNQCTLDDLQALQPSRLIISPGPGGPEQAGISTQAVQAYYQDIPILGVCLGHQVIAKAFGMDIIQNQPRHGKSSIIEHCEARLFANIPNPLKVGRYHSLIAQGNRPSCLEVSAWHQDEIMALSHVNYPIFGVQFHPESVLTEHGHKLINNFLTQNLNR